MSKKKGSGKNPANKKLPHIEKRPITLTGKYNSGMSYIFDVIFELITRKS